MGHIGLNFFPIQGWVGGSTRGGVFFPKMF